MRMAHDIGTFSIKMIYIQCSAGIDTYNHIHTHMKGRGKDMNIETLQKPLFLTRGTGVIEVWYSKNSLSE